LAGGLDWTHTRKNVQQNESERKKKTTGGKIGEENRRGGPVTGGAENINWSEKRTTTYMRVPVPCKRKVILTRLRTTIGFRNGGLLHSPFNVPNRRQRKIKIKSGSPAGEDGLMKEYKSLTAGLK